MINQDELNALLASEIEQDDQNTHSVTSHILSPACLEISINISAIGVEQANKVFTRIYDIGLNTNQHLILNVGACPFLSSFIIGQLLNIATEKRKSGFRLAIVEAGEMVLEVLKLTSTSKIIEVYPTTEDALKEFNRAT